MSTKKILLSNTGNYAVVDEEDYDQLNAYEWIELSHAYRRDGDRLIAMHREIRKTPPHLEVDHRDRDPLNNTRSNLRACTTQQNGFNRGPTRKNTSGYKGVVRENKTNRWRAVIRFDGKQEWLGTFKTKKEAARAYDGAARHYAGEFAYLNFPDESNPYVPNETQYTSDYRGVCWDKNRKKWETSLMVDGKRVLRGFFDDEEEAARAYDKAATKHLGEKARLNFNAEDTTSYPVRRAA